MAEINSRRLDPVLSKETLDVPPRTRPGEPFHSLGCISILLGDMEMSGWSWSRYSSGPPGSGRSWTSGLGRGLPSATVRQSLRHSPRRKAAVHSRWCARRATRGWSGSESAGGGSSVTSHACRCPQHLPTCLSVRARTHVTQNSTSTVQQSDDWFARHLLGADANVAVGVD